MLVNLSLFGHLGKACAAITKVVAQTEVWKEREKNEGRQEVNSTTRGRELSKGKYMKKGQKNKR